MKYLRLFLPLIIIGVTVTVLIGPFKNGIIFHGDVNLAYHFARDFLGFNHGYIWSDKLQSGYFNYEPLQGLFINKIFYVLNILIDNLYLFSYLWFFLSYFFYTLTFYFLIQEFIKTSALGSTSKTYTSITLSIVALINGIFQVYAGQIETIIGFIGINIFLVFFVKNLHHLQKTNKNKLLYLIFMALALSESTIYIHTSILLAYSFIALSLFYYKFVVRYWKQLLFQGCIVGLITFLLNTSWILPIFAQLFNKTANFGFDENFAIRQAEQISSSIFLNELFRLKSYSSFSDIFPFLYLFGIIPVGIFIYGLIKYKKNYFLLSLLCVFLVFTFFAYGIHPQTKSIYTLFWSGIPLFYSLKTVMKFSFVSLYAIIIALAYIISQSKSVKLTYLFLSLLMLFAISNIAFFRHRDFLRTYIQYKIPDYYSEVKDVSIVKHKKTVANDILLPISNWQTQYKWAPKDIDGRNILPFYLPDGTLVNPAHYLPDVPYIYNYTFDYHLRANNIKDIKSLLNYGNIDTIVYQKDIRFSYDPVEDSRLKPNFTTVIKALNNHDLCSALERRGELYFCKVNQTSFTPIIYPTNHIVQVFPSPFMNMVNETGFIMGDITSLEIAKENSLIYFAKEKMVLPNATDVYTSSKAFTAENCQNKQNCNLFMTVNVPPGKYKVYLKHILNEKEHLSKPSSLVLKMFFGVANNYLIETVNKLNEKQPINPPLQSIAQQEVNFKVDAEGTYVGEINLDGTHMVFQTEYTDFSSNSRFYFVKENNSKILPFDSLPIIEFVKINSTRYFIRIHKIKSPFFINFLQNFNNEWKVNLLHKSEDSQVETNLSSSNQPETGDTFQASPQEIVKYVKNGIVSYISENPPAFISKITDNTIQNNNLKTYFAQTQPPVVKHIDDQAHITSSGFANSWFFDVNKMCDESTCIQNADGTIDVDLLIDYSLQKNLSIGLFISYSSFIVCLVVIVNLLWRENIKKQKKYEKDN